MTSIAAEHGFADSFLDMAYREIKRYGKDGFFTCAMDVWLDRHANPRTNDTMQALDATAWSAGLKQKHRADVLDTIADGAELNDGVRPSWQAMPDEPTV